MVTVRTFARLDEAAVVKTLLENYEIPCALLHKNANSYYPLAVPIRLTVADDHAARAIQILNGDLEQLETNDDVDVSSADEPVVETANRNPWELLVLAFYLLVPAICILGIKIPASAFGSRVRYLIVRAHVTQVLSLLAVIFAIALITLYFRVRRSSGKSQTPIGHDKLS